jgi:hypothetical protein
VKATISSTIKAHLIRGACYLLLFLAVSLFHFSFGQRSTANRVTSANTRQLPSMSSDSDVSTASHAPAMPEFPTGIVLWDQYNNPATKPPLGIGSQEFEPAVAAFNDQAADDFVLPTPPLVSTFSSRECA